MTVDVRVVREGSGTLVSGGTPVRENGTAVDDRRGAAIRGGMTGPISPGDLVCTPAGVPHGIRDTGGITWLNIRSDIPQLDLSRSREPVSPGGGARAGTAVMDPQVFQSIDRPLSIGRLFTFNWSQLAFQMVNDPREPHVPSICRTKDRRGPGGHLGRAALWSSTISKDHAGATRRGRRHVPPPMSVSAANAPPPTWSVPATEARVFLVAEHL